LIRGWEIARLEYIPRQPPRQRGSFQFSISEFAVSLPTSAATFSTPVRNPFSIRPPDGCNLKPDIMKTQLTPLGAILLSAITVWFTTAPARAQNPPGGFSFISSARVTNGFLMNWPNAGAGTNYTVQSRDRLADSIWVTLAANQPWPTVQTQWLDSTASNQLARFYRVVAVPSATRGNILASNLVYSYSIATINSYFNYYNLGLAATYAVNFYKIDYDTIDPLGARIQASGALFLPQNVGKPLPLLSYQHGTTTLTNDVPSGGTSDDDIVGLIFGSAGYAAALPDYLGLGDGPGFHPYVHARTEATACVDLLRAARRFCASNSIPLTSQLFLAGYSQGGHATMALHRELENYHTNEFTITASAPMAGPYDMSGVELSDLLSARCPPNPYYYAYVIISYQRVYALASTWSDLFAPPYATTIPQLFNGNIDGSTINLSLPACNISNILSSALLTNLQNDPNCPFRQALRDNDVDQWKPVAPMHLYHCFADDQVPYANSQVAYSNFLARGASQVQLIDPDPGANHKDGWVPCLTAAKTWFDTLKQ